MKSIACCVLGLACVGFPLRSFAEETPRNRPVDFAREILPILSNKCFVCHGPDGTAKDVLRLDSYTHATRDLDGHKAIDPQALDQSEILKRIASKENPMPPADAEKQLTVAERDLLSKWIHQGGKYAVHWSFVPPKKAIPSQAENRKPNEMIDAFVEARLQKKGLKLAPAVDRETLARRVALVLTGLPPESNQLTSFLADDRPDAYERFVNQLLDSPRFGEHQARYWLDAVRYGDTHGLHLDNRRGIYPYRDWVIHALNNNLPWDKFIVWQLAGDLLPNPTLEQRVATGFVRMNPTTSEGGVIPAEFQAKNNFDRVETLGTVFLGMSLTCARCHTHKFDPITQTEYYRLLAFFNSTAESPLDGNKYEYGPVLKAPASVSAWDEWHQWKDQRNQLLTRADNWMTSKNDSKAVEERWEQADQAGRLKMLGDADGPFAGQKLQKQFVELSQQMAKLEKGYSSTLVAKELPKPRTTRLLKRGEYNQPAGDPLEPGVMAVMGTLSGELPRNRLGLARWLASREHPLVSRVLVNRFWQNLFGEGLVRTPEDFGLQGQQPTHPQLLDWLAVEFQDSGWNLKHLLRLMVTSDTFRQSSAFREEVPDPENRLLARGPSYRLDAEVIRDMALWSSELLDDQMGGEGVKPYQPKGLWSALMHPASNTKTYVPDKGEKLYRRSLYVYWKRTCPHPVLTLFDAPSRESSCVKRSRTNTSLQSLGLLNETQRTECARMLAQRLLHEAGDDESRLNRLFELLACREPSDKERVICLKLVETMRNRYTKSPKDAAALLSIGESPRDEKLDPATHAAWSQLTITVLASDIALLLY